MKITWNEIGTIIGLVIVCFIVYSNRNHPILTITGFIIGFIAMDFIRCSVKKWRIKNNKNVIVSHE